MKKIEPVAWIDDDGLLFVNDGIIPDGADLYTSDALLAVAEAVRDSVWSESGEGWNGEHPPGSKPYTDIQAIINQLTGE